MSADTDITMEESTIIRTGNEKMDQNKKETDVQYSHMMNDHVGKLIVTNAIPTMTNMVMAAFYNAVDTFFVAKLGTAQAGAVGIVLSMMSLITALGNTFGMGSCTIISRALGKKNQEKANLIANSGMAGALTMSMVILMLGLFVISPIMRLLGSSETILPYSVAYGRIIMVSAPITMMVSYFQFLMRAEGRAKNSLPATILGGFLNIVINPIFIFTLNLGVSGAAIATAISQMVTLIILIWMFSHKETSVTLGIRYVAGNAGAYLEILKNGIPTLFRQGCACIANIMLNHAAADFGDSAVAAMTVVNKLFQMAYSLLVGYVQGYQPVVGYNYGARQYKRVKAAFLFLILSSVSVLAAVGLFSFIFAENLICLFTESGSEVMEIGVAAFRLQCISMPFIPFVVSCGITFQAIGRPKWSTFTSPARQGYIFLPFVLALPKVFGLPGLEITQALSDICTFLVALPFIVLFTRELDRQIREENNISCGIGKNKTEGSTP